MVKNLRPLTDKWSSVEWLNALRNTLGPEYQSTIPEATQANIAETIEQIFSYQATRNQVADALVNRIGLVIFKNTSWTNPIAVLKRGMLSQGETIEEVMVGLIKAVDYDFDRDELEKEIFGFKPHEIHSRFHKVNRKDRYGFTVNMPGLRFALLNNELDSFLGRQMASAQTSDQRDEFLLMMNLFREVDKQEAFFNRNVPDVGDTNSDGAASRRLLRGIREFNNVLPFISRQYNPAGVEVAADPDDLILFQTATAAAAMDVEALAAAFQIDKAEVGNRTITVPQQYFGIPGVQAILTSKDFFVVADNLIETTSMFNPAKLSTNYWLHHWQVMSASPFAPLVMFNSDRPSTVITETIAPVTDITAFTIKDKTGATAATNVTRGVLYDVVVEGVTTPTGGPAALDLDVEGATSQFTYITSNGDLYIGPDEDANSITIRATSVDNNYNETTTRGIVGTRVNLAFNPSVSTDVDSDTIEEPVLDANTVRMTSGLKVKTPTVKGVNFTRIIKEAVTFTDTGDIVTVPKHGAIAGDTVKFTTITGTTGITAGTTYYVKDVLSADTFTIAATAGGAVIALTTNGTAATAEFVAKQGTTYIIAGNTEFVAAAAAGYEIAAGSTTSWSFDTP